MTEQPVKKGDWLILDGEKYAKVIYCLPDLIHLRLAEKKNVIIVKPEAIVFEKVNEKWKVMLLEEGRAKPEFKIGDVVVGTYGAHVIRESELNVKMTTEWASQGKLKVFFPVEKGIEVNVG